VTGEEWAGAGDDSDVEAEEQAAEGSGGGEKDHKAEVDGAGFRGCGGHGSLSSSASFRDRMTERLTQCNRLLK